ncbi:MAG TPA: alpha/beta hydrolase [Tepidisphaeraceae bacterium]|nr:alpha/beta hydrolase [Tepidisphaeraceae bacterium]
MTGFAFRLLHWLLLTLYLVLPLAALAWAFYRQRKGRAGAVPAVTLVCLVGLGISVTLNLIYATGTRGRPTLPQVALGAYFATAMLLLLRLFDYGLRAALQKLLRLKDAPPGRWRGARVLMAALGRVAVLFAVALPYVMATVMVYRPKVLPLDDPRSQLGFDFQRVEFTASDGVKLVGWWIPAQAPARGRGPRGEARGGSGGAPAADDWGTETALVCHGLAASKSNQLLLARRLVPGGVNVLAFDFRAHGESGGQLASFGAHEKRDVLAAAEWVRSRHPQQSRRIYGVGASMGAAALISAAADPSPAGQSIDAIAAYATYDDLWDLTGGMASVYFAPPMNWLLQRIGLPVASASVGADLLDYAPARDIPRVWPRPILLIHGQRDEVIPFARGRTLLEAASQPKYHLWYPEGSHNDIVADEPAARIVLEFFRQARAVPVI